jgi:hypothetical protein
VAAKTLAYAEDLSIPRDAAARLLGAEAAGRTLDGLARAVSELRPEDPVSVRDPDARPPRHSRVYFRGRLLEELPGMLRYRGCGVLDQP